MFLHLYLKYYLIESCLPQ